MKKSIYRTLQTICDKMFPVSRIKSSRTFFLSMKYSKFTITTDYKKTSDWICFVVKMRNENFTWRVLSSDEICHFAILPIQERPYLFSHCSRFKRVKNYVFRNVITIKAFQYYFKWMLGSLYNRWIYSFSLQHRIVSIISVGKNSTRNINATKLMDYFTATQLIN